MSRNDRCFYCGNPAMSREHAIPQWIPRHLNQTHLALPHAQAHNVIRRRKIPFADYAGYILCGPCNHHRLRPSENEVKPLLVPLLDGDNPTFSPEEQAVLAGWGAKVAYNLLAIERKRRGVPIAHRRHLLTHATPVEDCIVAYGRYTGDGVRVFAGRTRITPRTGTGRVTFAYHATVAFGQVVLRVYGAVSREEGDRFELPGGWLFRVWPPYDLSIAWPPLWTHDNAAVSKLAMTPHYRRRAK